MPFQTDDDETVLMHYTGLVQQTDAFKQAAESNQPTEWSDQYMRLTMRFDAGAERYRWLNTSLFVAKGSVAWDRQDRVYGLPHYVKMEHRATY